MYTYSVLKTLHIFAAMLFLGTGLGSAWYKLRADRSRDPRVIAWCARELVLADWLFTIPAGIALPTTALALLWYAHMPLTTSWVLWGFAGYVFAGITWLPAAYLQLRMRQLADDAVANNTELPEVFHRYSRLWAALGVPSFLSAILTVWVMVAKHSAFGSFAR